ncbi:MAG: hypothetical protein ACE5FG_12250 [Myxococcota bacterium]
MQLILTDGLPRNISYPVKGSVLEEALGSLVPGEDVGLYFLYISGVQLDYYDPLTSKETRYPVLILDNAPPPLCSNVRGRLLEEQVRRELHNRPRRGRLSGTARAEAQLTGKDAGGAAADGEPRPELKLPPMSILVLPVKTRFRTKVGRLIDGQGLRVIKNWFSCKPEMKAHQRPLVLAYDEESDALSSKFAEDWTDPHRPRFYF